MTAVDVDALDKLREAATADGEWRVLDIDNRPGPHSREILDDEGSVAVCSGDNDAAGNTIGADRAALIVAAVNALGPLLAEVRRGRALREAVNGLAAKYDQPAEPGPWPEGTRSLYGGGQVAYDLLAALAATDGTP